MSSFPETGLFPFNLSRADVSKTTPSTLYTVNEEPSANGIMNQGQPHDDKNPSENTTPRDESLTEPMTLGSKPRGRPADDRSQEESPRLQLSSDVPSYNVHKPLPGQLCHIGMNYAVRRFEYYLPALQTYRESVFLEHPLVPESTKKSISELILIDDPLRRESYNATTRVNIQKNTL
ncbi:hypothetical protein LSH36_615g01058 [Paralvinella palmiformis]|uniref:Uncharacterized protein n=1 Tax=Paralvinella palmiformis TaxID=53620 RepID=A0AAD9J629_9ANNE|nr:hypothetical protein LSH36_615g01058 [Paralvinella palmiformis]